MDKTKGKGERGKRGMMVGLVGVEWRDGDKMQTTVMNNNKKCLKKKLTEYILSLYCIWGFFDFKVQKLT